MPEVTEGRKEDHSTAAKPGVLWWLRQIMLTGVACFFIFFGISLLVASYRLGNPFSFIMTFFGASLMTLISVVMAMGFVLRILRVMKNSHDKKKDEVGW